MKTLPMPPELTQAWGEFWKKLPWVVRVLSNRLLLQAAFVAGAVAGVEVCRKETK